MLKLEFTDKGLPPVELTATRLTIGREKDNDLVLTDTAVSGFHAEIQQENGRCYIVDLGSKNGTYVASKRISGRKEIKAWDRLAFGTVTAEVVDPERRRPTMEMPAIGAAEEKKQEPLATGLHPVLAGWSLTGASEPVKGRVYPITSKVVIGRDLKNCSIAIDSTTVSSRHAELEPTAGGLLVRDLDSTNGTFVGSKKISEATLASGDELRIDEIRFTVLGPTSQGNKTVQRPAVGPGGTQLNPAVAKAGAVTEQITATQQIGGARLSGLGVLSGKTFPLTGTSVTIGRTADNAVVLDEATVSSKHAKLIQEDGGWCLEDTGSQNGTFVGGQKITSQLLKEGDILSFGKAELLFEDQIRTGVGGTSVMAAVDERTRTAFQPSPVKAIPPWAWGLGGFALVAIAFAGWYLLKEGGIPLLGLSKPAIVDARVQGGTVWEQQLDEGRKGPATPLLADINGDGMLDVVIGDSSGYLTALDGEKGLKIFTVPAADKILAPPIAAPLSGGKGMDVVIASNAGKVTAYNGEGKVLWNSPGELEMGQIFNRPVIEDLNGDMVPDIIVPTAKRGLVALDGSRGWEIWNTAEIFGGENIINAPLKADINGDGVTDFVAISESGHLVALSAGDGKVWKLWESRLPGVSYGSPVLVRVGKQSLVVVPTKGQGVIAIDGSSGRVAWSANIAKQFFASPMATDTNGDGIDDVVLISEAGQIHILDGRNGDELWSMDLGVGIMATPALFDVNGDGLKDLVVSDMHSNILVIDSNRGKILLTLSVAGAGGYFASPLLGDVNGDGLLEVVVAGQSGKISTLFLNRQVSRADRVWPEFLGIR